MNYRIGKIRLSVAYQFPELELVYLVLSLSYKLGET